MNITWNISKNGEHLEGSDEIKTSGGKKKEKLIEMYEGLPVIGEGVVVGVDPHGELRGKYFMYTEHRHMRKSYLPHSEGCWR